MVAKEKIRDFPDSPGVYLMKDDQGQVIYVGKALSLKKRVASYFSKAQPCVKNEIMLSYVADIGCRQTASEHEALVLEAELVKHYQPRFNTTLKDDKTFPYIKITQEDFPRVFVGRRKKGERGFDYFGPYTGAKILRRAVKILRKSFPFCSCRRFPKKVCLHYHLGLCPGPCQKKISKRRYLAAIRGLEGFLMKKDADLIDELSLKMRALVEKERFEEAAAVRDQLEALSLLKRPQTDLERLGLSREPRRIEAFDVSDTGGRQAVASMVSFKGGRPDKNNYRRFRIRTVEGIDDYAMIREAVRRRYERLLAEAADMPDLIVIDGGRGHLEAGRAVLERLHLGIPIISIAKNEELIYTVKDKNAIRMASDSRILRLLQRVRDEAHRFALKYHRLLRKKQVFEQ